MRMSPFGALFEPIGIGSMQLRNRIAMSAMTTNYGSANFEVTERLIAFHEVRAQGGAVEVYSIGDCAGPGLIAKAVADATQAACAIGRVAAER